MLKRFSLFVVIILGLGLMAQMRAMAAGGSGPGDALSPTGAVQIIAPHSAQWYRFDVAGTRAPLQVTLDANVTQGVRLAIYTPEQIANWQRGETLQAIGMGSPEPTHTLTWEGRFNQGGTYYAVVYNDLEVPIQVRVNVSGDLQVAPEPTPTWQPDPLLTPTPLGKGIAGKIAFVDAPGGNLYVVNGDGTNLQRVSFGLDPQWNHSGTQLALARQGPIPGIYTIHADGSNERLLYQTPEPRAPDWSPDDTQIVFSFQSKVKGGGERCIRDRCFSLPETVEWQLAIVNMSDGAYQDVRSSKGALTPTWNADGTIAYNDPSIGLMQTTATGEPASDPFIGDLRITSPRYNPLRIMSPQYSPDGKQIVYMVMQPPTWQIAIANADGSNPRLLTSDRALAWTHPSNVAPVWSPDGKQILFLSNRNGRWEFFVMNPDGTNVYQVLKNVTDQISLRYDFQSNRMMSWTTGRVDAPTHPLSQ